MCAGGHRLPPEAQPRRAGLQAEAAGGGEVPEEASAAEAKETKQMHAEIKVAL